MTLGGMIRILAESKLVHNLDPALTGPVPLNMANRRKRRAKEPVQGEEEGEDIVPATQFEPHESDDSQTMWDVIAILRESKTKYEVRWAGNDPATGKPWKPSWIPKEDCTNELIRDWKEQKRKLQEAKQSKKSLKRRKK